MTTIAGHTYYLGRCGCGRWRSDVLSAAREAIARGQTLVNEDGIAHVGKCSGIEWNEIFTDLDREDKAVEMAMGSV